MGHIHTSLSHVISPRKFIFEHGICVSFFQVVCVVWRPFLLCRKQHFPQTMCYETHTHTKYILHAPPRTAEDWFQIGLFFFWCRVRFVSEICWNAFKERVRAHVTWTKWNVIWATWATHDGQTCDIRHTDTFAVSLPRLVWLNPSQISVRRKMHITRKSGKSVVCPVSYYGQLKKGAQWIVKDTFRDILKWFAYEEIVSWCLHALNTVE